MEKLTLVAQKLIHKCQATFVKKHSIHDQINLVTQMTELCEITGQNGAIITLDQEKAYDKIRHNYLWRVLQEMNIPESLVNTIRSLYTNAETTIILNSEMNRKFPITRAVQQQDQLSCLLFNLTTKPMSHLLKTTDKLTGLNIDT